MKILAIIYPESVALYKTPEEDIGVHSVFIGEVEEQVSAIGSFDGEWMLGAKNYLFYVDLIQKGD